MATELLTSPNAAPHGRSRRLEIVPAHDVSWAEQAVVFTSAFSGYVGGSFEMDAAALARFICAQGADVCYSRVIRVDGALSGFAYISRTGATARLAAMGVVPAARGQGVARQLLLHVLDESKVRGDEAMMLEVIEQNSAACALYQVNGFRKVTRLLGWRRAAEDRSPALDHDPLEEISVTEACQFSMVQNFPELPWQVSRHAAAKLPAARAFRAGSACVIIGNPESPTVRVHALLSCTPAEVNWVALRDALTAVVNLYPQREFFTPAVFPQEFGKQVFQPLGFALEPISQLLMRNSYNL